jgi:hypothetical protein
MHEAKERASPFEMRHLFATILIFSTPVDCLSLYQRYLPDMAADHLHRAGLEEVDDRIENLVLIAIQRRLDTEGLRLDEDFGLKAAVPPMESMGAVIDEEHRHLEELRDEERVDAHTAQVNSLNPDQRRIFDQVMDSVVNQRAQMFALNACGGSGKTYLINTLLDAVRSRNKIALATATSGIAATLLHGGRTMHSRFKVS